MNVLDKPPLPDNFRFRTTAFLSLLFLITYAINTAHAIEIQDTPVPEAAISVRTLARTEDPVIVRGEQLPGMHHRAIEGLRAFALHEGVLSAIPFQVDEFDEKGRVVAPEGKNPRKDEDEGLLDSNDELVVMAADLGNRAHRDLYPSNALSAAEVEVTDPKTGDRAWLYIFDFENPPPPSPHVYVRYDPESDSADSDVYMVDFNERRSILLDEMRIKLPGGDRGPNLIDRIKVRTVFKSRIFITFKFNEEDITSKVTAYKNGPIRAIRSADYYLKLFFIKVTPSAHVDYMFYRNAIVGPSELKIPFNPKIILRGGSHGITGLDFNSTVHGWKFYSSRNPTPTILDGTTKDGDDIEKEGVNWFTIYGENRGTVTRVVYGPTILKAKQEYILFYRDDSEKENKPEREKGETMLGFYMDILKLPRGTHRIWFYQYFASPFVHGDEKKFNDILDNPLRVTVLAASLPKKGAARGDEGKLAAPARITGRRTP